MASGGNPTVSPLKPSPRLIDYVKGVEKFISPARHLPGDRPSVITGGYGFTDVREGDTFTPQQAESILVGKLATVGNRLQAYCTVHLTQGQFDALCDFVYNIGFGDPYSHPPVDGLRTSHLLLYTNRMEFGRAAAEFTRWVYAAGQFLSGLRTRRLVERGWFIEGLDLKGEHEAT